MNGRVSESQPGSKQEHHHQTDVSSEQSPTSLHATAPTYAPPSSPNPTDPAAEASLLRDAHLSMLQRQALATQIGRTHGNRYLQRIVAQASDRTSYSDPAEQEARTVEQAVGQGTSLPSIAQHLPVSAIAGSWELNDGQQLWDIVFQAEAEEPTLVASPVNAAEGTGNPVLPEAALARRYGYQPGTFMPQTTDDETGTNRFTFGHLPPEQQDEVRARLEYVETYGIERLDGYLSELGSAQQRQVESREQSVTEGSGTDQTASQLQGSLNRAGVTPDFPAIYARLQGIVDRRWHLTYEEWEAVQEDETVARSAFEGDFFEAVGDVLQNYGQEAVERTLQRESVTRIGLPSTEPLGPPSANPATLLFAWISAAEGLNQVYDVSQWNGPNAEAYRKQQIYNFLLHQLALQMVAARTPGVQPENRRVRRIYEHLRHQTLTYEAWLEENEEQLTNMQNEIEFERSRGAGSITNPPSQ